MKYFYCQSYQAFNLALAMNLDEEVTVITAASNVVKACEFLKMKCIEHKQFSTIDFIKDKNGVDKEINGLIEIIQDNELHFSHTQFAVFCFYLVKRLNDIKRKTVFHNFELVYSKPTIKSIFSKSYLFTKVKQVLIKNRFNLSLEVRQSSIKSNMLSLKLDYIKKKLL